jgi:hypothetical protein
MDGGTTRDLIARTGIGHGGALLFGAVWLVAAIVVGAAPEGGAWGWAGAIGVGLSSRRPGGSPTPSRRSASTRTRSRR